jgi:thiol peroxidase
MALIQFTGTTANTVGELPEKGTKAPGFILTKTNLSSVSLDDYKGKKVVLNIFPSVDTGTCAQSVHTFNKAAAQLADTIILCISKDLPFALSRFCGAEGIDQLEMLSEYKNSGFGETYGVAFKDGPFQALFSRAVIVLNEQGVVVHAEQVPVIGHEPDYNAALEALRNA